MWFTGNLSKASAHNSSARLNDPDERFGLFLGLDYIAWRSIDQFHFIPKGANLELVEGSDFVIVRYHLDSENSYRAFKIYTGERIQSIRLRLKKWAQINQEVIRKQRSVENNKDHQDLLDMSKWVFIFTKGSNLQRLVTRCAFK